MNPATCPTCGAAVPATARHGLCPACLLKMAAPAPAPGPASEATSTGAYAPIIGDYQLGQLLGEGGMGTVYAATQLSIRRPVAIKLLKNAHFARARQVERFRLEAEAAARLRHPNIVEVFEVGEYDGRPFYSMRLVEGENLDRQLALGRWQITAGNGVERQRSIARLMSKVAHAAHHAHQRGVLHRDLKPANILIDTQGNPHIADFGLAKLLEDDSSLTQTDAVIGTPGYMAPEQARGGAKQATVATDVYGLGAILYALLTGRRPFESSDDGAMVTLQRILTEPVTKPGAHCAAVDADLESICLKCLEKEPGDRFVSALELAEELDRFVAGQPVRTRPIGRVQGLVRWCRRHPGMSAIVGLLLVLLASTSIAAVGWFRASQRIDELERKAQAGDRDAQRTLSEMFQKGIGVPQNFAEAARWLALANRPEAPGEASRALVQAENPSATATAEPRVQPANPTTNGTPEPESPVAVRPTAVSIIAQGNLPSMEVKAAVATVETPPLKQRTAVVFVKNTAGKDFNVDVAVVENEVASLLASQEFHVISRQDVINAIEVYPSDRDSAAVRSGAGATEPSRATAGSPGGAAQAEAVRSTLAVAPETSNDQNLAANRRSLGTKLDRKLSDETSAVRLAANMGAEYVLFVTLGSFGRQTVTFNSPNQALTGASTKYTLRGTYKITDAYKGAALGGGTFTASKAIRQTGTVQVESADLTNELINDGVRQVVEGMTAKVGKLSRPAEGRSVSITIASYAKDLAGNEISLRDIQVTEGKVTWDEKAFPALASATVKIDGFAVGVTPVTLTIAPGPHKIQLERPGFEPYAGYFLAQEGVTLAPTLQMSDEGFRRWKEIRDYLNRLDKDTKLTDAQVEVLKGYAQVLRQTGYIVDLHSGANQDVKQDVKVDTKQLPVNATRRHRLLPHWLGS